MADMLDIFCLFDTVILFVNGGVMTLVSLINEGRGKNDLNT